VSSFSGEHYRTHLSVPVQGAAAYLKQLRVVIDETQKVTAEPVHAGAVATFPAAKKKDFRLSLTVIGAPPATQMLKVQSNQVVKAIRLDYLLSSGACITSDDLDVEGYAFEVPIDDKQIVKVWNTPRVDRHHYDHSGPAKLRILLIVDGVESTYTLPIQMDSYFQGSSVYRKLTGSEVFSKD